MWCGLYTTRLINLLCHCHSSTAYSNQVYCNWFPARQIYIYIYNDEKDKTRSGITQLLVAHIKNIDEEHKPNYMLTIKWRMRLVYTVIIEMCCGSKQM